MSAPEGLPEEVKTFIVQGLACADTPSAVAGAVKAEFGIDVSRRAVHVYDPTKRAGAAALSEQWKALFAETRKAFLEDTAAIGIANKAVRLRALDRMAAAAEARGNLALVQAFAHRFVNGSSHPKEFPKLKPLQIERLPQALTPA
jgi:hypothetical protein